MPVRIKMTDNVIYIALVSMYPHVQKRLTISTATHDVTEFYMSVHIRVSPRLPKSEEKLSLTLSMFFKVMFSR